MNSTNRKGVVVVAACVGLAIIWACDGFTFSFTFSVPKSAEATATQYLAMPAGAGLVVNNENGSTRVTVDASISQAEIEITRIALADTEAEADDLLEKIVVQVTAPTGGDNNLRISAPKPEEATGHDADWQFELVDDELNITGVLNSRLVAIVRLRIKIPPNHAVDVTSQNGAIRAVNLDTASSLTTGNGSVRVRNASTNVTVRADNGAINVEDHRGTLDAQTDNGSLDVNVDALAAGQQVIARTQNGNIEALLPSDIDAELTAETENGFVDFDRDDFDDVPASDIRTRRVTATLNGGGPTIDLDTGNGWIEIDGG